MRRASFGMGPSPEGCDVRGRKRRRRTRAELCTLHRRILDALVQLPTASPERMIALANLWAIRRVLAQPNLSPR